MYMIILIITIIKAIFLVGPVWSVRPSVCVYGCVYFVHTVSPPPQQVEEDEDYVQVDHESSVDVFLWIQTVAQRPHQQLAVDHQELRQTGSGGRAGEEDLGQGERLLPDKY